ncbi:MAG TPA: 50S ribosomal protein L11 methyltransferase [Acetobacteraceae bacterium]|nr:50S ribosomal protein L11 methyltransferase [Acetobacteraceae bacterium]
MMPASRRRAGPLETISVHVPEAAVEAYEAALASVCDTVAFFRDHATGAWRVEGIKAHALNESDLAAALALAGIVSGVQPTLRRSVTDADGWLAKSYATFPEQLIGRRFCIRGTHLRARPPASRLVLTVDAGLAFGSGEHGSTRGCLRALEQVGRMKPRRILDLGTGSGILAMAAALLLRRPVLASDVEPWSVHVAKQNVRLNQLTKLVRVRLADGWNHRLVRSCGPYDLVFANILARPLCLMARQLAQQLRPGACAVLSGLTRNQERWVLTAHRRCGMKLQTRIHEGSWTTLVLRR